MSNADEAEKNRLEREVRWYDERLQLRDGVLNGLEQLLNDMSIPDMHADRKMGLTERVHLLASEWRKNKLLNAAPSPVAPRRCPTCDGPDPTLHPAVQAGGEVQLCRDPWHKPTADEIEASETRSSEASRIEPDREPEDEAPESETPTAKLQAESRWLSVGTREELAWKRAHELERELAGWMQEHADLSKRYAISNDKLRAALSATLSWKPVSADDPTRGVAWVDWDATYVGKIGFKGQRYLLCLPQPVDSTTTKEQR